MENVNPHFSQFANGVQHCFNPNQNDFDPQCIETTPEALEYQIYTKYLDKPLQNELEVLRYHKVIGGRNNNNHSVFNVADEVQKIKSGYYLNIDESLNIFKQYHDSELNPFLNFHEGATEHLKFIQKQTLSARPRNNSIDTSEIDFKDSELDEYDEFALFHISNATINKNEQNADKNSLKTVKTAEKQVKKKLNFNKKTAAKQHNHNISNKRQTRSGKVYFSRENSSKNSEKSNNKKEINPKKVLEMSNKVVLGVVNTSTPNNSLEKTFNSYPLSPVLPPTFPYFSSREIQSFQSNNEVSFKQTLEKQFKDSVFEENGRISYPILTNNDFAGFNYDFAQELTNNKVIKTEIFCRFWKEC